MHQKSIAIDELRQVLADRGKIIAQLRGEAATKDDRIKELEATVAVAVDATSVHEAKTNGLAH